MSGGAGDQGREAGGECNEVTVAKVSSGGGCGEFTPLGLPGLCVIFGGQLSSHMLRSRWIPQCHGSHRGGPTACISVSYCALLITGLKLNVNLMAAAQGQSQ